MGGFSIGSGELGMLLGGLGTISGVGVGKLSGGLGTISGVGVGKFSGGLGVTVVGAGGGLWAGRSGEVEGGDGWVGCELVGVGIVVEGVLLLGGGYTQYGGLFPGASDS